MKRVLFLILYVLFALGGPLIALDYQFSFVNFPSQPITFKIGIGGFIGLLIIVVFFSRNITNWAKSFDRVTWFKGFFRWLVFIFPAAFGAMFAIATYHFGELVVPIMVWTFLSHMVAGIFLVLAEKEKVDKFKKWVTE
jgi:hypothetical protein